MSQLRVLASVCFLCLLAVGVIGAIAVVGRAAPDFAAKDIGGQEILLSSYRGKIVVLEWTNANCPYVKKQYSKETNGGSGNMQTMQRQFTQPSVGVIWLMIDSSSPGTSGYTGAEGWKSILSSWGAHPTALIVDDSGDIAKLYGASRTPEVFVIGKNGALLYRGAVDSLRGTDPAEIDRASNLPWLKHAVENAVRERRVIPPETIPYGCPIK